MYLFIYSIHDSDVDFVFNRAPKCYNLPVPLVFSVREGRVVLGGRDYLRTKGHIKEKIEEKQLGTIEHPGKTKEGTMNNN